VCSNTCTAPWGYAGDNGWCEDRNNYDLCPEGSDCADCGPRILPPGPPAPPPLLPEQVCTNTCAYAANGNCDDGGSAAGRRLSHDSSSAYSMCALGTDCIVAQAGRWTQATKAVPCLTK
jgi:hypothetical protein